MKRLIIAALFLVAGALQAAAEVDTQIYRDVIRPGGHQRSADARHADGRACGASSDLTLPADAGAFRQCMRAHGWRYDHTVRDRTVTAPSKAEDMKKRPWCYAAHCDWHDLECLDDPSNSFNVCGD